MSEKLYTLEGTLAGGKDTNIYKVRATSDKEAEQKALELLKKDLDALFIDEVDDGVYDVFVRIQQGSQNGENYRVNAKDEDEAEYKAIEKEASWDIGVEIVDVKPLTESTGKQRKVKYMLSESYEVTPEIKHIDEVYEGMQDNADDDTIDFFSKVVNRVKKALKAREQDIAIIIDTDNIVDGGKPVDKSGKIFVIDSVPMVYEQVNGNTWCYFKNDDEATKWWRAQQDASLEESASRRAIRKSMNRDEILRNLRKLAKTDGGAYITLSALSDAKHDDAQKYEQYLNELEAQHFTSPVDILQYVNKCLY